MTRRDHRSSVIENASPQCLRGLADRPIVAASSQFPYRAMGQVVVEFGDGRRRHGVGTLLSDYTILTAGRLVKDADNTFKDIAKMYFVPAAQHLSRPYGIFDWCFVRAIRSDVSDWALISLAEPAGRSVGYLGTFAQLPHDKWVGQAGFSFFGQTFGLQDEMSVVEDVQIKSGDERGRLVTDQISILSQPGAPLVRNWHGNNPQVIAMYVDDSNRAAGASEFMPGWGGGKNGGWLTWLCDEFGKHNGMDRFEACQSEAAVETFAMQPDYSPFSSTAHDAGPAVRFTCSRTRRREQALGTLLTQG